ncbi:MAG TPA: histidinol-phosphate transaminase [Polyangiaceae bacterium]
MNPFWSEIVHRLVPYVPGEQPKLIDLVKLNTNENPYGPSPAVHAAIAAEGAERLHLYPDPDSTLLKQAVAETYAVEPAQVFLGNGSDEVLAHTFHGLLKHDRPLAFPDITYSFYPVYCGLYEVEYTAVPLDEQLGVRVEDYFDADFGAIIFANPNAPTGRALELEDIRRLLEKQPNIVVAVDEAYVDFGADSAVGLVRRYPNLLVIQTLSKSRGLAGLRVGFAIGQAHLIEALERIKNCFNSYPIGRLAVAGATAALRDTEYFTLTTRKVIATRERLTSKLTSLGFEVLPSKANFVFARHPERDASELARGLRERKIIVRHFRQARIEQFLRISIGTDEQCERLVDVLRALLGAA